MYIKKTKRLARRLVAAALSTSVLVVMLSYFLPIAVEQYKKTIEPIFQPDLVEISISNIYSEHLVQTIKKFIKDSMLQASLTSLRLESFAQELKQTFKVIKIIEFDLQPPKKINVSVVGGVPHFIVNKDFIIAHKRRLFKKDIFSDFDRHSLQNIEINTQWLDEKLDARVYDFLQNVSEEHWDRFEINYHAPEKIELTPKKSICPCKIIADSKSFSDERKLASISNIFEDLVRRKLITHAILRSQKCNILFDIRFKNRIYVKFLDRRRRGVRL